MKNVLITGVSSGIGNTLTKKLIKKGFRVWGVARRKKLLNVLKNDLQNEDFYNSVADVADEVFWGSLIRNFKRKKFIPNIIIFNAAISENDLINGIDLDKLRGIMEVNLFSIIKGIKLISESFKSKLHFITISSTSAFKGNHEEGIGYAASKGALSLTFESLFQKYSGSRLTFTTIYLGPVETDMVRLKKAPFMLTKDKATDYIIKAIYDGKPFYYYPKTVFTVLSIMRLLPKPVFFKVWSKMQKQIK